MIKYFFLFLICLIFQANVFSQGVGPCELYGTVYLEEDRRYADLIVFEVEDEYEADLLVFKDDNRLFADESGIWFMTDEKHFADFRINITNDKRFADFKIFFVEYRSEAGCNQ